MNDSARHPKHPSNRKLAYLRLLAEQTGGSFTYPSTDAEANREIGRLKRVKKDPVTDARRERRAVQVALAGGPGSRAGVRDDELGGYGSTARWA